MIIAAIAETLSPLRAALYLKSLSGATVSRCPTLCSTCPMRSVCLPCGLRKEDTAEFDQLVYTRRRVRRGEHVYHEGDPFKSLYAFRVGFFKSYVTTPDGETQVTGFPMAGDVVGMDGIESDRHRSSVVALEDGEVCIISYAHFEDVARRVPAVQHQMHRMMSREFVLGQEQTALLGGMRAETRVAAFLLSLSGKFAARGYSASRFNLRMSREEIGSYLGLRLESVSRTLSRLQAMGLISAQLRSIVLTDLHGLRKVVSDSRGAA